jgi:hypothetical protein
MQLRILPLFCSMCRLVVSSDKGAHAMSVTSFCRFVVDIGQPVPYTTANLCFCRGVSLAMGRRGNTGGGGGGSDRGRGRGSKTMTTGSAPKKTKTKLMNKATTGSYLNFESFNDALFTLFGHIAATSEVTYYHRYHHQLQHQHYYYFYYY